MMRSVDTQTLFHDPLTVINERHQEVGNAWRCISRCSATTEIPALRDPSMRDKY